MRSFTAQVENFLTLLFWVWISYELSKLLRAHRRTDIPLGVIASLLLGTGLFFLTGGNAGEVWNQGAGPEWETLDSQAETESAPLAERSDDTDTAPANAPLPEIEDALLFIPGGAFMMGSPETENWRVSDETPHEVRVSEFYLSPYEVTQSEYEAFTGVNPSAFAGENLPVENVSWLDAARYCNLRSAAQGLTPAYRIEETQIVWDRSADGYRLPTEAEWEYACRAGTVTPFNNEKSISPDEANYYGHYPYEIEENYTQKQ